MNEILLHDSIVDNDAEKIQKEQEEKVVIYNEDKSETYNLDDLDLNKGRLETRTEVIHHEAVAAVEEVSHYEVIAEYPNGGKDVEKVIDRPGQEAKAAYDETVEYQVYVPYSETDIRLMEIEEELKELKKRLAETDYQAIKYLEGWYTFEAYAPIRDDRENWRYNIRVLEKERAILNGESYEEPVHATLHLNNLVPTAIAEEEEIAEVEA